MANAKVNQPLSPAKWVINTLNYFDNFHRSIGVRCPRISDRAD
jgi:hypothetical protein